MLFFRSFLSKFIPLFLSPFLLIFSVLYSIWAWSICVFCFVSNAILSVCFCRFYKDPGYAHFVLACRFIQFGLFMIRIRYSIKGLEHIPPHQTVIIISNHQSLLDIAVLMAALPIRFSFFAKKELLRVPLLRNNMINQDHFIIDRQNPRIAIQQLSVIKNKIENGRHALIFAEGTRSTSGNILPFKRGAFQIAVESNTPILPCYIHGTRHILKKNSLLFSPKKISIELHSLVKLDYHSISKHQIKNNCISLSEKIRSILITLSKQYS